MPEWLMGADCKSAGYAYVGSNPTRPNLNIYIYIYIQTTVPNVYYSKHRFLSKLCLDKTKS